MASAAIDQTVSKAAISQATASPTYRSQGRDPTLSMAEDRRPNTTAWSNIAKEKLVEAAGVEPASENVTGQEPTCVVQFLPQALPWDVRGRRSERTRNGFR